MFRIIELSTWLPRSLTNELIFDVLEVEHVTFRPEREAIFVLITEAFVLVHNERLRLRAGRQLEDRPQPRYKHRWIVDLDARARRVRSTELRQPTHQRGLPSRSVRVP